jgi:hypothetical protein
MTEQITFYAYQLPKEAGATNRSSISFELSDWATRDLSGKWETALSTAISVHRTLEQRFKRDASHARS